jgi:hypothetical protein
LISSEAEYCLVSSDGDLRCRAGLDGRGIHAVVVAEGVIAIKALAAAMVEAEAEAAVTDETVAAAVMVELLVKVVVVAKVFVGASAGPG